MPYGLTLQTIEAIQQCLGSNDKISEAILYGSRAKGNYKNGSDIDMTLKGEHLTLADVFALEEHLDNLLLPYTFDLSIFRHIDNPDLLEHIQRVGVSFFLRK